MLCSSAVPYRTIRNSRDLVTGAHRLRHLVLVVAVLGLELLDQRHVLSLGLRRVAAELVVLCLPGVALRLAL